MPSSGYQLWNVVAGEQPTTSKWNILGNNDASFNSGVGLNDGAIVARHYGAKSVPLSAMAAASSFFAYVGATPINCVASTWSPVVYNTVWFNTGATPYTYNTGTGRITFPYSGIYHISGQNSFGNATNTNNYLISMGYNSAGPSLPWTRQYISVTNGTWGVGMSYDITVTAGDYIIMNYYAGSSATTLAAVGVGTGNIPTAGDATYVSIHYLGPAT